MSTPKPLSRHKLEFSTFIGVRDRPRMDDHNQSNVPGLYIAGDLADAPVIKIALQQGHDVARHVAAELGAPATDPNIIDVLIVGAGPAGAGAALALQESGLRVVVIERSDPFATIHDFPLGKMIFSEPRELDTPGDLWFEDAPKEELVRRWCAAVKECSLPLQFPEAVQQAERTSAGFRVTTRVGPTGLSRRVVDGASPEAGAENHYTVRRIILAVGKRGKPNQLGIPGEDAAHVQHRLVDPSGHTGRSVVVVGGGDSAVEAAVSLAENGARVTLSYRGDDFVRAKRKNRDHLAAAAESEHLELATGTRPIRIGEGTVELEGVGDDASRAVAADDVFVFIGSQPPVGFLRRLGVKLESEWDALRWTWLAFFASLTWMFYVLKHKKAFFPFRPDDLLGFVPDLLSVDLGFRTVDPSFWGTVGYSMLVLVFGVRAYRRYASAVQKRRYISLIVFQVVFLFGIPELLAPLVIDRPWKVYAATVPWPLSIWSMVDAPGWVGGADADQNFWTAVGWLAVGAVTSFGVIPWYVRRNGQQFCSYLCGCGGLAETLGDFWRHLAPRGRDAKRGEWFGRAVMLAAVPVTLLILNDAWGFFAKDALYSTKTFAEQWYGLVVDFGLASILGVALYPYLGNRMWCRFFCPLRAWMEVLARWFSKISIRSNDRCIGCGECTRYCQMGIDVQRFAQKEERMDNSNSACIQCGICIEVCPMDVLELDRNRPVELKLPGGFFAPPAASWER